MKLTTKITAGLATTALLALSAIPVFAVDNTISGNGALSDNTITVSTNNICVVKQKSNTSVNLGVTATSSTGQNTANGNVGSGVTVGSGDASSTVTVDVTGGDNSIAAAPCCGCDQTATTDDISGNGAISTNAVDVTSTNVKVVKQRTRTSLNAGLTAKSKTGKNHANGNVGGTVGLTSGLSTTDVGVTVTGGGNSLP